MHVLDVFEVIYMDIYVFAILKCRELKKNRKNRKYCGLFAVRDGPEHTAKLTASRTATKTHGNGSTLGNDAAHGKGNEAHDNEPTLGNGVDARRRHNARQSG
jgi:hypothetical protein